MRTRSRYLCISVVVAAGACRRDAAPLPARTWTGPPPVTARDSAWLDSVRVAEPYTRVEEGDQAARASAVRAFTGRGAPLALMQTLRTVEGDPIHQYLVVQTGAARLIADQRADSFRGGAGVTAVELDSLWIGVWDSAGRRWVPLGQATGQPNQHAAVRLAGHPRNAAAGAFVVF